MSITYLRQITIYLCIYKEPKRNKYFIIFVYISNCCNEHCDDMWDRHADIVEDLTGM